MTDLSGEKPEWLATVNREGESMDLAHVVPLDPAELIATAMRAEGLADFGEDDWREPFEILVHSLDTQADLSLFGRVGTRDMLLTSLRNRLRIEHAYACHPEIADEVIREPVIVVGLPRSGTSILFETLMQDEALKPLLAWEIEDPCPPPTAATYQNDPRIARADVRITRRARLGPRMQTMHELGARIPGECGTAHSYCSFRSESVLGHYNLPDYAAWLATADLRPAYAYHKRLLRLLQWKNPRAHWLLKSPPYLWHLDELFETFPDARVIFTHRDPLRALASGVSLIRTMRGMWSDRPVADPASFAQMLDPATVGKELAQIVDRIQAGRIPQGQIADCHYARFITEPLDQIEDIYRACGFELTDATRQAMTAYLAAKPQAKFGAHAYDVPDDPAARKAFTRYQDWFAVRNEA